MPGEILNAPSPPSAPAEAHALPRHLLYSIFARIGGSGLDTDAFEALRASHRGGFLGKAVAYDNRQKEIPSRFIHSLRWHPVRLISFLDRPYYYGAKKKYLDWIAARQLETREAMTSFTVGRAIACNPCCVTRSVVAFPSLVEIPTWHRDRGKIDRQTPPPAPKKSWKENLLLERERFLEEYELADLLVVLSEKAADTFRVQGFPRVREALLLAARSRRGTLQTGSTPTGISRGFFRRAHRTQRHSSFARGLASARSEKRGALADRFRARSSETASRETLLAGQHSCRRLRLRCGELFEPGNDSRFPVDLRRQRESHLRSRSLRVAADHDARGRRCCRRHGGRNHHSARQRVDPI